jgi:hypothetical protein
MTHIVRCHRLDSIFAWREQRKVTSNLTLHYERKLYLLADTPTNRKYAGKYFDVYQFPDGKIEIRAARVKVPCSTYDKLGAIDRGAIVENKSALILLIAMSVFIVRCSLIK